jgi:hypothetical protein
MQGQGHTPRASTSTARTTATSVHTNSGLATGNSKMPAVPRSSTSTIDSVDKERHVECCCDIWGLFGPGSERADRGCRSGRRGEGK